MKKKLLYFTLIPLAISGLVSCNKADPKTFLDYGKIHLDSFESAEKMSYDALKARIDKKESFAIVISKEPGSCSCWDDFEPILVRFMKKYDLDIKQITAEELNTHTERFGLFIDYSSMPAIAFFKEGALSREVAYLSSDSSRQIFKDETGKALEDFFFQNAYLPKMKFIEEETLESYISSNKEFNLYLERSECGDCSLLNTTVLKDWNLSLTTVNEVLYIFDMQKYWVNSKTATPEEKAAYQTAKDKYQLSEAGNADFGYSTGAFPTLQRRKGNEVKDMCVVYNDSVSKNTFTISSYFTAERVQKMKYLEGTGNEFVLNGKVITEAETSAWRNATQPRLHDPIAKRFINYYVK